MSKCNCEWEKVMSGGMVSSLIEEYYSVVCVVCPNCGEDIDWSVKPYPEAKLPDYGETPGLCSDCIDKDIIIEDLQDTLTAIRAINKAYVASMRKDQKIIKWFVGMIVRLHNIHPNEVHKMLIWWGEIFRVLPKRIFRKT